jgi:hypothetical protein
MKYHTSNCIKVNKKYFAISLKSALEAGCKPCNECSPPTKVEDNNNIKNLNSDKPIEFSKVIYTDSVGKEKIFVSINDWFASNFKSANDVIQMSDKEAGVIVGKGALSYSYGKMSYIGYDGFITYTIKVYIKDNRFKLQYRII